MSSLHTCFLAERLQCYILGHFLEERTLSSGAAVLCSSASGLEMFRAEASLGQVFICPRGRRKKYFFLTMPLQVTHYGVYAVGFGFGLVFYYVFWFHRVTDEVFNFLLVWYYCTLTIRESILISNGSRYCATCQTT